MTEDQSNEEFFLKSMDISVSDLRESAKRFRKESGQGCVLCDYLGHKIDKQGKAILCSCAKEQFRSIMYQLADVPKQYLNKELDDWNVNADSLGNDLGSQKRISERVNTLLTFYVKALDNIINGVLPTLTHSDKISDKMHSLLFEGGVGSGKTFIASVMVKEAIRKNYNAKYFEWSELCQTLGDFEKKEEIDQIAEKFKTFDFIVIDGIENYPYFTPYFYLQLDRICKARTNSGKPYMLFSNGTHFQVKAGSGWQSLLRHCLHIRLPQSIR
jgi:DNA replication protein DnaC